MSTPSLKTIEITISPTGQTKLVTRGFSGSSCRQASKLIEEALGTKASEQLTAEAYQAQSNPQHQQAHG